MDAESIRGGRGMQSNMGNSGDSFADDSSQLLEALGRLAIAQEKGLSEEEIQARQARAEHALRNVKSSTPDS